MSGFSILCIANHSTFDQLCAVAAINAAIFSFSLHPLAKEKSAKNFHTPRDPPRMGRPMFRTRLPVLRAITLIAVMIFNCGVAVAEPNQTSADYIMPGCRDAASLITFSNAGQSGFPYGLLCGNCCWPQRHGSALRNMCSNRHDFSASHRYRRSVHRRTAREDSRGLQSFCC